MDESEEVNEGETWGRDGGHEMTVEEKGGMCSERGAKRSKE
jgi:hypothetical protein